jgi:hypothetical protein
VKTTNQHARLGCSENWPCTYTMEFSADSSWKAQTKNPVWWARPPRSTWKRTGLTERAKHV